MSTGPRLASIEAWALDVPVTPVPRGTPLITSRDYTVVRVRDEDGATGAAWGLARRAPIDLLIRQMVAPSLLGAEIGSITEFENRFASALGLHYREGLLARATSLIDVALVDLLGTVQGVPAWRVLDPTAEPQPLLFSNVVGFEKQAESDAQFVNRVLGCINAGYGSVKLAASALDPEGFARRLTAIRRDAPDAAIVVDLDGFWVDVDGTVAMARSWEREDIASIEDPVRIDRPDLVGQLHDLLTAPLAIGDEATSLPLLLRLAEDRLVDTLRADLTCVGGLTASGKLATVARANETGLSFHAYPWIHQHAAAANGLAAVESFELDSPFEVSHRFLSPLPTSLIDGVVHVPVPTAPGLGVEVDWDFVERHRINSNAS